MMQLLIPKIYICKTHEQSFFCLTPSSLSVITVRCCSATVPLGFKLIEYFLCHLLQSLSNFWDSIFSIFFLIFGTIKNIFNDIVYIVEETGKCFLCTVSDVIFLVDFPENVETTICLSIILI